MENTIILTLSLGAALAGNIIKKLYIKADNRFCGSFFYTFGVGLICATVLFIWGGLGEVSSFTLLLGVIFGLVTALQCVTNLLALQIGPLSYTSVIISFSTLISALSGVVWFGESIGILQIVGILLMLASFWLANGKDANGKRASIKWLILCSVAFFATGAIGILQKLHQSSPHKEELNAFLIVAFAVSSTLSGILFLFLQSRTRSEKKEMSTKKCSLMLLLLGLLAVGGFCVAVNNKFNLYLSGVIPSAVFFPLVNGGGLILTTLAALLIFRERLTVKQWIGVGLGIA